MELVMLVGLPGSGKSSAAKRYEELGYTIYSSDAIRKELYGKEEIQGKASEVFAHLTKRMRESLKEGVSCVMDSTNLRRKRRMHVLRTMAKYAEQKTCVIVLASPETCLSRNAARERNVPEEAIYRMLCSFETPYYYEGWDRIRILYNGEPYVFPRGEAADFLQDNPYHTLTLGQHMDAARDHCIRKGYSAELQEAAWYHDIGKLYTKRFANSRGVPTEIAHYYGHENYGAYLYLCEKAGEEKDLDDILYQANLINWHMRPLTAWQHTPKREDKDRMLMGETMYEDLVRLRQADMEAH